MSRASHDHLSPVSRLKTSWLTQISKLACGICEDQFVSGSPWHFSSSFWPCHVACGIWILQPGIEPGPLAHWTDSQGISTITPFFFFFKIVTVYQILNQLIFDIGLKNFFLFLVLAELGLRFCVGFSLASASGATLELQCLGFSLWWLLWLWSTGSRAHGLSSCGTWAQWLWLPGFRAQAQSLWRMGLVVLRHVGSFWSEIDPCLLHWQADSLPLSHQGSPSTLTLKSKCFNFPVPVLCPKFCSLTPTSRISEIPCSFSASSLIGELYHGRRASQLWAL